MRKDTEPATFDANTIRWGAVDYWNSTQTLRTNCLACPSEQCLQRIGQVSTFSVFPLQKPGDMSGEDISDAVMTHKADLELVSAALREQGFKCTGPAECANRISAEEFEQLKNKK